MNFRPCPNDQMLIPRVAETPGEEGPIRFFWCWSCAELTAFVGDPGELVGRFREDGRGGWSFCRIAGSEQAMGAVLAAVTNLKPDLEAWNQIPQCGVALNVGIAAGPPLKIRDTNELIDDYGEPMRRDWSSTLSGVQTMCWSTGMFLVLNTFTSFAQWNALNGIFVACAATVLGLAFYVGLASCCRAPDRAVRRWANLSFVFSAVFLVAAVALGVAMVLSFKPLVQQQRGQLNPNDLARVVKDAGPWLLVATLALLSLAMAAMAAWLFMFAAIGAAFRDGALQALAYLALPAWPAALAITLGTAFVLHTGAFLDAEKISLQARVGLVVGLIQYGLYLTVGIRAWRTIEASPAV